MSRPLLILLLIFESSFAMATGNTVRIEISPFADSASRALDVLLVVDDSAGMTSFQKIFQRNVAKLAPKLRQFASFHLGVITTSNLDAVDPQGRRYAQGVLRGVPAFVTEATPDLEQALIERVAVGTRGSGIEEPFNSVMLALAPELAKKNAGFLRPDAHLQVILVSDANDQSQASAGAFVKYLRELKGAAGFSLTALTIPDDDVICKSKDEEPPQKIIEALAFATGRRLSLCSGDYDKAIDLAAGSVGRRLEKTLVLPYLPDVKSLSVKYGDVVFIEDDRHRGYVYDPASNSIRLGDNLDFETLPPAELVIEFKTR